MIFGSIFLLFQKYKKENYDLNRNSKETFILVNNWFMIFYLITVLLGTIYPIFTDALTDNKISVGPPFYNAIIFPVVVVFLLFMALGPKAKWIKNKFENIRIYFLILTGAISLNLAIIFFFKSYSLLSNFIIISSLFLIISSLMDTAKAFKKNKLDFARIISHTSFGFLVLFIGLNDIFSLEKDYNIKLGETKKFENYSIQLQNLDLKNYKNYQAVIGKLEIKNIHSNQSNILNPEIRIYDKPKTLTYEAAIKTSLIKDYYLTMSNIDRSDYYNIKFQKKPLMAWIWISVIMIVVGGSIRLFGNAKNN
jgi:cytochrome c-type biogenesis protein CcmF